MKKIILLLFFMAALPVMAQVTAPEIPFIDVTGTAKMEVVPDIIYISIVLRDKVLNKENYTITVQEDKLKKGLTAAGIDIKNLVLSGAGSDIVIYKEKEKGVEETKEYVLKVNSATQVSAVFELLHTINIKEAGIQSASHTRIEEFQKEVRINAIKAAKDKATYLLAAIGEQPGKALAVSEVGTQNYHQSNINFNANRSYNGVPEELEAYMDFKKITIEYSYNVKYSIK